MMFLFQICHINILASLFIIDMLLASACTFFFFEHSGKLYFFQMICIMHHVSVSSIVQARPNLMARI